MTSPEDESVLSAYLDGELDPLAQRTVESALATDGQMRARVRALTAVRDLVSDLSHPAAPDLSEAVVQAIQRRAARPRRWKRVRQNLPWLATGLASAAALALVMVGLYQQRSRGVRVPVPEHLVAQVPAADGPGHPAEDLVQPPSDDTPLTRKTAPEAIAVTSAPRSDSPAASARPPADVSPQQETLADDADRRKLRALMDDPRLRRVFLVTDQLGSDADERVAAIVDRSTRRDYFKITISQGIVVDPANPDRAVVFAVAFDETELRPFRKSLQDEFKGRLKEHAVEPAVAMQLADIGEFVSLPAHPAARVTIPRADLAMVTDGPTSAQELSAPVRSVTPPPAEDFPVVDAAGNRTDHPAAAELTLQEDADREPNSEPVERGRTGDHHQVVLIWVTSPRTGS